MMYNINFIVKYKQIEEELLEKIKRGDQVYSEEDVLDICQELYRHEILSVFNSDNIEDSKIHDISIQVWRKMKEYQPFLNIFEKYREKMIFPVYGNDVMFFIGIFNYNTFYILHQCICQYLNTNEIDLQLIELFQQKIDEL